MVTAKSRHDRFDTGAAQAVEGQAGDVRVGGEAGLIVRPAGEEDQDTGSDDSVHALLDQLERGRVDPMGVLKHHKNRLSGSQTE